MCRLVKAMHLYSFKDLPFPFVYILPRDTYNYLYSFSFLLLRSSTRGRVNAAHLSLEGPRVSLCLQAFC